MLKGRKLVFAPAACTVEAANRKKNNKDRQKIGAGIAFV
jgi:hypothetical protein